MQIDNERIASVEPTDIRDALLALCVAPAALLVRYSVDVVTVSAEALAGLINVSPLKGPVQRLGQVWDRQLSETEKATGDALELVVKWVLAKLDMNEIVESQVDIEAIIKRVDVVAIASQVIDELNLPEIVRNSSQTMAAETVSGLRSHGMSADRSVSDFIDRLMGRNPRAGGTSGLEQPT